MLVDRYRLAVNQKRVLLANPDGFSNEAYRKLTGVDRDQAYREIQELVTLGIIDGAPSSGRGAVYRISSSLKQQRTWLESRLPKICDFLAHNRIFDQSGLLVTTQVRQFNRDELAGSPVFRYRLICTPMGRRIRAQLEEHGHGMSVFGKDVGRENLSGMRRLRNEGFALNS